MVQAMQKKQVKSEVEVIVGKAAEETAKESANVDVIDIFLDKDTEHETYVIQTKQGKTLATRKQIQEATAIEFEKYKQEGLVIEYEVTRESVSFKHSEDQPIVNIGLIGYCRMGMEDTDVIKSATQKDIDELSDTSDGDVSIKKKKNKEEESSKEGGSWLGRLLGF